jgi:hypothetical protein
MTLPNHFARRDVQRGEQRGRTVPNVVVGLLPRDACAHRQQRTRAIQRLHLAFLVKTGHQRVIRRIEIQTDDVADLLHKLRVGDSLKGATRCDCKPKVCQNARNRGPSTARTLRHAARRPLSRVRRRTFERAGDHVNHAVVPRGPQQTRQASADYEWNTGDSESGSKDGRRRWPAWPRRIRQVN